MSDSFLLYYTGVHEKARTLNNC